jgi:hypothetical protein
MVSSFIQSQFDLLKFDAVNTDLINAIMAATQDKRPTEDRINAIIMQVCCLFSWGTMLLTYSFI